MSRRHQALIPLTHDHHHALVQARGLIKASQGDEKTRVNAAREFLDFYRTDTLLHFHEEEEILFPPFLASVDSVPQVLVDVLVDHVCIHGMASALERSLDEADVTATQLIELGEALRAHVRTEENELFPLIERSVEDATLRNVSFAERNRAPKT